MCGRRTLLGTRAWIADSTHLRPGFCGPAFAPSVPPETGHPFLLPPRRYFQPYCQPNLLHGARFCLDWRTSAPQNPQQTPFGLKVVNPNREPVEDLVRTPARPAQSSPSSRHRRSARTGRRKRRRPGGGLRPKAIETRRCRETHCNEVNRIGMWDSMSVPAGAEPEVENYQ